MVDDYKEVWESDNIVMIPIRRRGNQLPSMEVGMLSRPNKALKIKIICDLSRCTERQREFHSKPLYCDQSNNGTLLYSASIYVAVPHNVTNRKLIIISLSLSLSLTHSLSLSFFLSLSLPFLT